MDLWAYCQPQNCRLQPNVLFSDVTYIGRRWWAYVWCSSDRCRQSKYNGRMAIFSARKHLS